MPNMLTKDDLLKKNDTTFSEIEIEELGGMVNVRHITVRERENIINIFVEGAGPDGTDIKRENMVRAQLQLVADSIVDGTGSPMFTVDELFGMSVNMHTVIDKLYCAAEKVNAVLITSEEEVEKNLETR